LSLKIVVGSKNLSSWSLRPWLALAVTGAPFTEEVVQLDKPDTRERLLARSPTGKVPVLIDGTLVVHESLAICEYLADRFPDAGLWPADATARALARAYSCEMHAGFQALRREMPMHLTKRVTKAPTPEVAADIARLTTIFRTTRNAYGADGAYLFGRYSIADAMFTPVATRFRSYGVTIEDPIARDYCTSLLSHPAFLRWEEAAKKE
jgi:glutathione S-transferase